MFASGSIAAHLLRGGAGFGLLACSVVWLDSQPAWAMVPLVLGIVALRGCPTCWTLGLIQTLVARLRGQSTDGRCVDGSCATASRRET
jgi:hypothetical protein